MLAAFDFVAAMQLLVNYYEREPRNAVSRYCGDYLSDTDKVVTHLSL